MIIDARDGYAHDWNAFDVKRCASVKYCVWVNDETAQWGRYVVPHDGGRDLRIEVVQENRITIYPYRKLVLFNEVDLGDEVRMTEAEYVRKVVGFRRVGN